MRKGVALLLGLLVVAPVARADFPAAVPLDSGGVSNDPLHAETRHLEVSADGAQIYALEVDSASRLSVVARDPSTGRLGLAAVPGLALSHNEFTSAPDGRHLYLASGQVITRDLATGALSPGPNVPLLPGPAGASGIAISPDGEHVYVADYYGKIFVYDRDPLTGALTFVEAEEDGVGGVDGLYSASALVVSPDGAHVYVVGWTELSLVVFARDSGTGALSFVEVLREGVGGVTGLDHPDGIAVSPDGAHVFVLSVGPGNVAVFARDAGTGTLSFVEVQKNGVGGVTGMDSPTELIVSGDGAYVYVAAWSGIAIFARNATTGALTFVETEQSSGLTRYFSLAFGPGDEVYVGGRSGVMHFARDGGTGLLTAVQAVVTGGPAGLAVSPDGAHVYTAGGGWRFYDAASFVSVFARDAIDGSVDWVESHVEGVAGVQGLAGVTDVTVSPDGAHVYATAGDDDSIAVFERAVPAGTLTFVEAQQDGVAGVDGMDGAAALALSADGAHVYVASQADDAVAVFARNGATGGLTFVEAHEDGVAGVDGLLGAIDVAASPDGNHVYVASYDYPVSAIAIFARNPVSGALTFLGAARNGVGGMSGLVALSSLVVSGDGLNVYVSEGGPSSFGVTVLARNASTGLLSFVETLAQGDGEIYAGAAPLALAPDGTHLYAGAGVAYVRDDSTGRLRFVGASRVVDGYSGSFVTGAVDVSPDGRHVYFRRSPGLSPAYASSLGIVEYSTRTFGCAPTPLAGCRSPGRGKLRLLTGGGGQVVWSWAKGEATDPSALGDPRDARTHYALCLYEGPGSVLSLWALAPAGGECKPQPSNSDPSCWRHAPNGFKYRDDFTSPEGVYTVLLRSGSEGRPQAKVRARGEKLRLPALPLAFPLRVQLQAANGECFETTHATANVNDGSRVIAAAD